MNTELIIEIKELIESNRGLLEDLKRGEELIKEMGNEWIHIEKVLNEVEKEWIV